MSADENFYPRRFLYDFDVHFRHLDRYMKAIKLLNRIGVDEVWLDCACGSGYGTQLISNFTDRVVGYDINSEAISYATANYGNKKSSFFSDINECEHAKFDVVISIETIEHMNKEDAVLFLAMIKKRMGENSVLIITTPLVEASNANPTNPYHLYEYSLYEFQELLEKSGLSTDDYIGEKVVFTDGEEKTQGYFKCTIQR